MCRFNERSEILIIYRYLLLTVNLSCLKYLFKKLHDHSLDGSWPNRSFQSGRIHCLRISCGIRVRSWWSGQSTPMNRFLDHPILWSNRYFRGRRFQILWVHTSFSQQPQTHRDNHRHAYRLPWGSDHLHDSNTIDMIHRTSLGFRIITNSITAWVSLLHPPQQHSPALLFASMGDTLRFYLTFFIHII